MSTELNTIKTKDGWIVLTSFYGGPKDKECLQISTSYQEFAPPGHGYNQLTLEQALDLAEALTDWIESQIDIRSKAHGN